MSIEDRLENWGRALRTGATLSTARSIEGRYRSPQQWYALGAVSVAFSPDLFDAAEVESAVSTLPLLDGALLRAWYVLRWSEPRCLWAAAKATGDRRRRYSPRAFTDALRTAQMRVEGALGLPACVRRVRCREKVAAALAA
jgi:hypothetical protein